MDEDTYDKAYVADRTIGFEEFKKYILGEVDGVPKTPEWAEAESTVKARVIRALAREWAAKRTVLSGGSRGGEGGACRTAFGTEWARMMVLLQAMQGVGKPGRTIWGTTMGAPSDVDVWFPAYADLKGRMATADVADFLPLNPTKQRLRRLTLPDAILTPPVSWYGEGFCGQSLEQQFKRFTYPMEGYSEVKMFYRYGGSLMGTMSDTAKWVRMYQSPDLEFVVNQDIWINSETRKDINLGEIILEPSR
jgi:trimethylamine-N-oxide reductase (cytochrome c)